MVRIGEPVAAHHSLIHSPTTLSSPSFYLLTLYCKNGGGSCLTDH